MKKGFGKRGLLISIVLTLAFGLFGCGKKKGRQHGECSTCQRKCLQATRDFTSGVLQGRKRKHGREGVRCGKRQGLHDFQRL